MLPPALQLEPCCLAPWPSTKPRLLTSRLGTRPSVEGMGPVRALFQATNTLRCDVSSKLSGMEPVRLLTSASGAQARSQHNESRLCSADRRGWAAIITRNTCLRNDIVRPDEQRSNSRQTTLIGGIPLTRVRIMNIYVVPPSAHTDHPATVAHTSMSGRQHSPMCSSSRVLNGPSRQGGNSLSVMPVAAMDSVASPLAASLQIGAYDRAARRASVDMHFGAHHNCSWL